MNKEDINIENLAEEYLGIKLKYYQKILLKLIFKAIDLGLYNRRIK